MTTFRITMTGIVKNVEHRHVKDKSVLEFSMCRKNKTKEGEPDAFTWVRGSVWDAPDWMVQKIVKGAEVTAINGDCTLRGYKDKDGNDKVSLDARFSSYDVQVHGNAAPSEEAKPAPAPRRPAAPSGGGSGDDEPPFRQHEPWAWG